MQPSIKNDLVYLLLILESVGKIIIFSERFSDAQEFFVENDQMNFDASLLLISNIGEQSKKISAELRKKYPEIEWQKIKSLRNRITHDYTGIDKEIVFTIIRNELPDFKSGIQKIIFNEISKGTFDKEEFEVARSSQFYKHVDFDAIF